MENYTQLGIAGLTLGILFFIVRYFVKVLTESRNDNKELTKKFIKIAEKTLEVQHKSTDAIDRLTKMIYQLIKNSK